MAITIIISVTENKDEYTFFEISVIIFASPEATVSIFLRNVENQLIIVNKFDNC